MYKKIITILTILITLTFISACSQEDCSLKDTTYEKFTFNKELGECVSKKIKENVCGNKIPEDKETYCNCPSDVKKTHPIYGCSGTTGEYLENTCNEKTKICGLYQNKKVVNENKELQFKNSNIIINGNFNLNRPFILNTQDNNKVEIQLSLFNTPSTSKNIEKIIIKDISIENSKGVKLGKYIFNKELINIGDKTDSIKIELADTIKAESKETLKIKINIEYTIEYLDSKGEITKTENKIETLTSSLGSWEFINPNFY